MGNLFNIIIKHFYFQFNLSDVINNVRIRYCRKNDIGEIPQLDMSKVQGMFSSKFLI